MKDPHQLKREVESLHHCEAHLAHSVPVREGHGDTTVWEDVVHVFDVSDHPKAGSDERRLFAVPRVPPITAPVEAVRTVIVVEQRSAK